MLSDLCEHEDHGACFENEWDGCYCACHPDPEDCPAVRTSTGGGRAHDSAASVPPTAADPGTGSPPTVPGTSPAAVIPRSQAAAGDPTFSAAALKEALGAAADHTPPGAGRRRASQRAAPGGPGSPMEAPEAVPGGGSRPGRGDPAKKPLRPGQDARKAQAAAMSEAQLEENVRDACKKLGILRFHVRISLGTTAGLPDDILIGPRGILWRELKRQSGKPTSAQVRTGEALTAIGQDWALWKPEDWFSGRIQAELAAISGKRVAA